MAQKFPSSENPHIVVIGGGISGMAATCRLLDSGYRVLLIEKRPYLGGKAFSFVDRDTGQEVDNGQHVFLGCCTSYIKFLAQIGTLRDAYMQPKMSVTIVDPNGKSSNLKTSILPSPFHCLPSFLTYKHLNMWEKLLGIKTLLRLKYINRNQKSFHSQSFYRWLKRNHQSDHAIENFWNVIIKACANDDVRNVDASIGMMIFQEAMLNSKSGSRIGYSKIGLSPLMGQAAGRYIEDHHGRLLLGRSVSSVILDDADAVTGVLLDNGQIIESDAVISTIPPNDLTTLLSGSPSPLAYFAKIRDLSTAPIVNVHIWYDRPVMYDDFVAFVNSPLQWVFNRKTITSSEDTPGRHITISLSAAFEYINRPKHEIEKLMIQAMADAFPLARTARVERAMVIKQPTATLRCLPGIDSLRPSASTPINRFFIAGEWTATGWPSTMEGAVRSGIVAADTADASFLK